MAYRSLVQHSVHDNNQYQVQETTRTPQCTPSSREKCSLAFILATQHNDVDDQTTVYFDAERPHERDADSVHYHTPTTATATTAASFSNITHTPTHEQLKVKRRRPVATSKTTASSKSLGVKRQHSKREETVVKTMDSVSSPAGEAYAVPTKKGSKYCIVDGCGSRAKHARKCWKHGGSVKCKVPDCVNRAKTKGVCWSHGGGTICSFAQCATISVSNGVCWAHGGGKRCAVDGCSRPAYERTANLCTLHFDDHRKTKKSKPAAK
ncbi:hypothetical protein FI667_g13492, partial [Globisporangium splendens]